MLDSRHQEILNEFTGWICPTAVQDKSGHCTNPFKSVKMPKKAKAIFLSLALLLSWNCFGFPIDPVTLRSLIEESDLIVHAKIEAAIKKPGKRSIDFDFLGGESPARLQCISALKGTPPRGFVEVHFNPNLVCPAPPHFPVGSNVIAFLQRNKGSNGFHTVALSYGAKIVSEDEAREFSQRVIEMVEITAERDSNSQARKTTEWLVKCIEGKVARWDGAADLTDRVGFLGQKKPSDFSKFLTAQQIGRMSNALFQAEYVTSGELALVEFFQKRCKPEVVNFLISYLRRASIPIHPTQSDTRDSLPESWNVYDVMVLLAELTNSTEAKAVVEESQRTSFFDTEGRISRINKYLPVIEAAAIKRGYAKSSSLQDR